MITRHKPWKHQQEAFDFIHRMKRGALLAMTPGAGKTKVTIDLIQNSDVKNVLIVCPKSVTDVWPAEVEKHAAEPDRFTFALPEGSTSRVAHSTNVARALFSRTKYRALVVNYETVWREPFRTWALLQQWDLVVADESHRIKSAGGKASTFFARLRDRTGFRLGLSGTPMPHSPLDLYAQYRFFDPTIFGTRVDAFKAKYAYVGGFSGRQIIGWHDLEDLQEQMYRIAYYAGEEVLDLPPKVDMLRYTVLEPSVQRKFKELQKDFITTVVDSANKTDRIVTVKNAAVKLMRLQQMTNGWAKPDGSDEYLQISRAKEDLCVDVIYDLPAAEPVVVFCRYHAEIDALRRRFRQLGRTVGELSGRKNQLRGWQLGSLDILLVQEATGAEGIDLTRTRYGIFYTAPISPGQLDQLVKRIRRPGQTRPVTYFHLLVRHTYDEKIYRALENGKDVIDTVLKRPA